MIIDNKTLATWITAFLVLVYLLFAVGIFIWGISYTKHFWQTYPYQAAFFYFAAMCYGLIHRYVVGYKIDELTIQTTRRLP